MSSNQLPIQELLALVRQRGMHLSVDGENLRVRAPAGAMTPQLREQLSQRKAEIIDFLLKVTSANRPADPLTRAERPAGLPLSFAQERLWLLEQVDSGTPTYNLPGALRMDGALDRLALERSLNEIVRRHEALRTTFALSDGIPLQIVHRDLALELPVTDLQEVTAHEREPEVNRRMRAEAAVPFDLEKGPLLRARLWQLGPREHVLFLCVHHIVADGWSIGVVVKELAELYDAYSSARPARLPELAHQYADFAAWQRQWFESGLHQRDLAFWRRHLDGAPAVLELPGDRTRPPVKSFSGDSFSFELPGELLARIKSLGQAEGVTLFSVLLTAFYVLLYRFSGCEDLVVGVPVANRIRAELEPLVGFFVNPLPVRARLGGSPPFRQLLRTVSAATLEAFTHQNMPFDKLVEALRPARTPAYSPIFQVCFVMQNAFNGEWKLPGLTLTELTVPTEIAKFDLTFVAKERGGKLEIAAEYSRDLFEEATARRLLGHFESLISAAVAGPDTPIDVLSFVSIAERQVLAEWNATTRPLPPHECIHEMVQARARQTPDAIAVADDHAQLTFRELDERANQLAHYLRRNGVRAESLVAIAMERSLELFVAVLGVLKAGGAYVPIDPNYPPERIAFMLQDAGAKVLLTQKRLVGRWNEFGETTICLDANWPEIARESRSVPESQAGGGNLAYMVYTSGSSGRPKGVLIEHRGLCNLASELARGYGVTAECRVLQPASFSFDAWASEVFATLTAGGTLFVPSTETLLSPVGLPDFLRRHSITTLTLTPSMLAVVPTDNLPQLHTVISAGEACSWDIVARWQTTGRRFINAYGPTEATVGPTYFVVGEARIDTSSVPIGRPIGNMRAYVLDKRLQAVPVGVPGELHLGGIGLARGYHGQPDLTAARFIVHPETGERIYKTGDLARWHPDGVLEFLGRLDEQVKVRGFRIETGEIEAVLKRHAQVRAAAVVVRESAPGDKRLIAYVVSNNGPIASATLREHLRAHLPEHMVPSAFVALNQLPLTPNGKIDQRALPVPHASETTSVGEYAAPRNAIEHKLVQILQQVLKLERLGIHDNFFEIGGDSILAILLTTRAREAGLQITPRQLFQNQTIAALAAVAVESTAAASEPTEVSGASPLTPIQHWFFEHAFQEPHHWNQAVLFELPDRPNVEFLRKSIRHLLLHHDALRFRYRQQAVGSWIQEYDADADEIPFRSVDLSTLSDAAAAEALAKDAAQQQASLVLAHGPLLRAAFYDFGAGRPGRLLLVIHHLVVDGVSWHSLIEDLELAYRQLCAGSPVQLAPKSASFKAWAEHLSALAQSGHFRSEADYWCSIATEARSSIPPDLDPAGPNTEASAEAVVSRLGAVATASLLQGVPPVYRTQINDVLLTALLLGLHQCTGANSAHLWLEGHGREDLGGALDTSRTVGWFTALFPVALRLPRDGGIGAALMSVKEQLRAVPNKGIGFGVLRYLDPDRGVRDRLAALPAPKLEFNYLGQLDATASRSAMFRFAPESAGPMHAPAAARTAEISINAAVTGGELQMQWSFSRNLHRRETIERAATRVTACLQDIVDHCRSAHSGGVSPSDFASARLSQTQLDHLVAGLQGSR